MDGDARDRLETLMARQDLAHAGPTGTRVQRWLPFVCRHESVRCAHGDEIVARRWRRRVCLVCGRALRGDLPTMCFFTEKPHPQLAQGSYPGGGVMAPISKDFENELLISAFHGSEAAREALLSIDTGAPRAVPRDDVELLLSFAVNDMLVFMPGVDRETRLEHATALCKALRVKPARDESGAKR